MTDYLAMKDHEAYQACGADASKWADYFCQCARGWSEPVDRDVMQTWFANAMMAMHDSMTEPTVRETCEGCGHCVPCDYDCPNYIDDAGPSLPPQDGKGGAT